MTDSRNRRASDGIEALFDPKTWARFERQLTGGIEKAFRTVTVRKEVETVVEATETSPAETREVLVATLEIPGVAKENVSVVFAELDHGFTRLSITTKRGDIESLVKAEFRESVIAESATAAVDLGILTVRVPVKADDTKAKFDVPVA